MTDNELRLIGCVLHNPDALPLAEDAGVCSEHFGTTGGLLWREAGRMYHSTGTITAEGLYDALKDTVPTVHTLVADAMLGVTSGASWRYYARALVTEAKAKTVREIGAALTGATAKDADELAAEMIQRLGSLSTRSKKPTRDVQEVAIEAVQEIEDGYRNKAAPGIMTGLSGVDDLTHGFRPGQLVLVAGRTSMGKSTLLLNWARHMAESAPVLFFSLEVADGPLVKCLGAHFARVNHDRFVMPASITGDSQLGEIKGGLQRAGRLKLFLDDCSRRIGDIETRARVLTAREGVRAVYVDYCQRITGARERERYLAVGEIGRRLKDLAIDLKVPVIAAAQLNRAPDQREDHRPKLSDLKESGDLEQDADVVCLVYRPAYYDPSDSPHKATVGIAKNRTGATGAVEVYCDLTTFTFADLEWRA